MYLLYSAALALATILSAPWWLIQMMRLGKYRAGLSERLGNIPARLARPTAKPVIWIHAVSVGETLAISELVAQLRLRFPNGHIYVSTTTQTGQRLARERFGPENVFYFPLDFAFAIRPYLSALRPDVVVLAETEFWPNFIRLVRASGARLIVANARISDRSLPRYRRFRSLLHPVLANIDRFLAQSEQDASRLVDIGAPRDRVSAAGNLKFDVKPPTADNQFVAALRAELDVQEIAPVFVAGSTTPGEEPIVLDVFKAALTAHPKLLLILAPRHKERFDEIARLLDDSGLAYLRRSLLTSASQIAGKSVLLLDTIGELAPAYSLADLAFVGGSLIQGGGHNILEPAYFGVATIVGPHTENFRDIIALFQREQSVLICTTDGLSSSVLSLLADPAKRQTLGRRARATFESQQGATQRTIDAIAFLARIDEVHQ